MAFKSYDKIRGFSVKPIKGNLYVYVFEYRKREQTNEARKRMQTDCYTAVKQKSIGNLSKPITQSKLLSFLQLDRGYSFDEAKEIVEETLYQYFGGC